MTRAAPEAALPDGSLEEAVGQVGDGDGDDDAPQAGPEVAVGGAGGPREVRLDDEDPGFAADANGPVYDQVRAAVTDAWGVEPVDIGAGGSIPFVARFAEVFPEAAILVTGVEDPDGRAHGANESLHLGDFRNAVVAEALLLARLNHEGSA